MSPLTQLISCSFKLNDQPAECVFGEKAIRHMLDKYHPEDKLVIGHNMSGFDSMILAWRLGRHAKLWGCTLSMARPIYGSITNLSLGTLVKFLGLGVKNNDALLKTKGKRLEDFTPDEIAKMRVYNIDDSDLCWLLWKHLRPYTSNSEMWVIDSNIRMLVEPEFVLDKPLLEVALARERMAKRATLRKLGERVGVGLDLTPEEQFEAIKKQLMSAPKFAALMKGMGVDVPMKPSPKDPEKFVHALAKTDPEFKELLEHDDPLVAAAAAARLEVKSTLLETRIGLFLNAAEWTGGLLPIPTKYYGAHTGRDSGEQFNALNLPRINRDKDDKIVPKLTNALRLSIRAPKGKLVVVADLSGIELRLNHTLWKVPYSMEMWRQNPVADLYKETAVRYYGIPADQIDKPKRQFGKVMQLGCGFQVGPPKFKTVARTMGGLILTDQESEDGVYGWRRLHPEIADRDWGGWARCQKAIEYIAAGQEYQLDPWGLCFTSKLGIHLPDGRIIRYPNLRASVNEKTCYVEWKYGEGRNTRYIYGGKTDENVIQSLGRTVLMDNVKEIFKQSGLRPKLRIYDEPVYVVDEGMAEDFLNQCVLPVMRKPPIWWPELVVWSEGDLSPSYGLAK